MAEVKDKVLLQVDVDIKGLITGIATGRESLQKLFKEQAEVAKQMSLLAAAGKEATQEFKDLQREAILLEQKEKALTTEIRNQEKAVQLSLAADQNKQDSLRQLQNQLAASIREWNLLSESERETSERGKALSASITSLNTKLKEQEASTGRNQRNVGNYAGALESVKQKLTELANLKADINKAGFENAQNTLDDINAGISNLAAESKDKFSQVQAALLATGKTTIEQAGSLKELTQLIKAYSDASLLATDDVKAQFVNLAAEAKDKLGDIKQEIKNLASDTSTFNAITEGVKTVVAGFTLIQGASGLFGKESENIQLAIQKTASALLVLNSVTEITNALQKESSLVVKATAAAQFLWNGALAVSTNLLRIFGITTSATTVGVRIFTAALISTGIGALVVGIGLLIANFSKVKSSIQDLSAFIQSKVGIFGVILSPILQLIFLADKLIDILPKIGKAIGLLDNDQAEGLKKNAEALKTQQEAIVQRYEIESRLAKAAGQDTATIEAEKLKAQKENITKQIGNLLLLKQANGKLTDDQIKDLDELKKAYVKTYADIVVAQKEFETEKQKIADKLQTDLLAIEIKRRQLEGSDTTNQQLELAEKEREQAVKIATAKGEDITGIEAAFSLRVAEIQKEAADKQRALAFDVRQSIIDITKDGLEKEIAAEQLARDRKLAAVSGNSKEEIRIRENILEESKNNLKSLNQKFAEEELQTLIRNEEHELEIRRTLAEAKDQQAIAEARTQLERNARELEEINHQSKLKIEALELAKKKELAAEDKLTADELQRIQGTKDFKLLSEQEKINKLNGITEQGAVNRELIQQKYDALEFESVKSSTDRISQVKLEGLNALAQADLEFANLRLDAGAENASKELDLMMSQLNAQEAVEISSKQRTEEEKNLIHEKYEKLRTQITLQNEAQKLGVITNALDTAAGFFSKDSAQYKALAISKALINTYLGVTQSLAAYAWPFNAIAAAASLAAGLQNVDAIRSQKSGFYDGGYTGDGNPTSESTAVGPRPWTYHKREYVIPHKVLSHPEVSPFVKNVIEPLRRRTHGRQSVHQFSGGGFAPTAGFTSSQSIPVPTTEDMEIAFTRAISKMPAPVTFIEDIKSATDRTTRLAERQKA
ncbi:MAG: hypothetical protein IPP86_00215 [Bacteroidetes bacterium]|nr:hypothetical protein [Bacteroidota bacterium]